MKDEIEEKIHREIIRRAIEREEAGNRALEELDNDRISMETLKEMTNLSEEAIDEIIFDVRLEYEKKFGSGPPGSETGSPGQGSGALPADSEEGSTGLSTVRGTGLSATWFGGIVLVLYLLFRVFSPIPSGEPDGQVHGGGNPAESSSASAESGPDGISPQGDPVVSGRDIRIDLDKHLHFVRQGFPMGLSSGQTSARGLLARPFETLSKEPAYESTPLYGCLVLGNTDDRIYSFAIEGFDTPTPLFHLDANNNEDLTDDGPPHTNQGSGTLAMAVSLTVEIAGNSGKFLKRPYDIWLWINDPVKKMPCYYSRCHYRGRLSVGGTVYPLIAFETFNHDALYRDCGIWVDINLDGKLDKARENFKDGEGIFLGGKEFRIHLDFP